MNDINIYNNIINQIINNFDFTYMLSINIFTYLIIKTIDEFNGDKEVKGIYKKLILIGVCVLLFIINVLFLNKDTEVIFNSTIAAPVFWSWFVKPILNKYGINYKK